MPTNLEALTDRIYQDGVEKAQKEAEDILEKARAKPKKSLRQHTANQGKYSKRQRKTPMSLKGM